MPTIRSRFFMRLALASSIAMLAACGGDDSSGSAAPGAPPTGSATGTLTDSAIAGVQYSTSSGVSGVTDSEGHFDYNPGDTVTFRIGSLTLGTVTATGSTATITPLQIAQATPGLSEAEIQNKVTNLLVLLQSLDSDGDASNGITIPVAVGTALNSTVAAGIDLLADSTTFAGSATLDSLADTAGGTVVDPEAALAHFRTQFLQDAAGVYLLDAGEEGVIAFRFGTDGSYLMAEVGAEDLTGQSGIERGKIDWNPQTGEITASGIDLDTNGQWGLSHFLEERLYLSRDGDDLVVLTDYTDPEIPDESITLSRLENGSGIVGPWALNREGVPAASLNAQQFLFLANGKYLMIDPIGDDEYAEPEDPKCGDAGLEYGAYTLAGGVLTISGIITDTNDCAGLYDNIADIYTEIESVEITNGVLSGTIDGENQALLLRPDFAARFHSGEAEVIATTTGTPISQEGGAYEIFCTPDEVGEIWPLEMTFAFNAEAGTFTVAQVSDGGLVESSGTYDVATGALFWEEVVAPHVVLVTVDTTYYSDSTTEYTAIYDATTGSISGSWTDTVATTWDRDASRVSCTTDAEFSLTAH